MQCTDVFFLKADVCQLGVDQRKVNMLARDYCDAAGRCSVYWLRLQTPVPKKLGDLSLSTNINNDLINIGNY